MVLDHTERLTLTAEATAKYCNEINTLRSLQMGLAHLNGQVAKIEGRILATQDKGLSLTFFGNVPSFSWVPKALVSCSFHWYATSLCNYVWLVGWVGRQVRPEWPKPRKYAASAIPTVLRYRDKVAAHFAKVFPRKGDHLAVTEGGILPSLTFQNDRFYVGALAISTGEDLMPVSTGFRWSLTETHGRLSSRYWPQLAHAKAAEKLAGEGA